MKKRTNWILGIALWILPACGGTGTPPNASPTPTIQVSKAACVMTCTNGIWMQKEPNCPGNELCYVDGVQGHLGGGPCGYASNLNGSCR